VDLICNPFVPSYPLQSNLRFLIHIKLCFKIFFVTCVLKFEISMACRQGRSQELGVGEVQAYPMERRSKELHVKLSCSQGVIIVHKIKIDSFLRLIKFWL